MTDNIAVKAKKVTLLAKFYSESILTLHSGIDEFVTEEKLNELSKDRERLVRYILELEESTRRVSKSV